MKKVRMLTDGVGGNGEELKTGEVYELEDASADHWLKRRKAELASDDAAGAVGKPTDGLKVEELKAALEAKGIAIPDGAKKADLAALLDAAE